MRLTTWEKSTGPKTDTSDPRLRLEGRVRVTREKLSVSEWVAVEDAKGRICRCGCAKPIRVRRHHRRKGIPSYLPGHQPKDTTQEVGRLHEQGLLTSGTAARMLGIKLNRLRGLEGKLYEPVPRESKRGYRLFTAEQVEQIRQALGKATRPNVASSRKPAALFRKAAGSPPDEGGRAPT
jgi:hypothetical protein